jgi:hypothetical protein
MSRGGPFKLAGQREAGAFVLGQLGHSNDAGCRICLVGCLSQSVQSFGQDPTAAPVFERVYGNPGGSPAASVVLRSAQRIQSGAAPRAWGSEGGSSTSGKRRVAMGMARTMNGPNRYL